MANVGLFEHCTGIIRQLIDLFREKKAPSPITNSLLNSLMCSRDSFQSNIFEENGFSIHPLDVRYRVALLIDSWNKDDIRIGGINQSIYDFPDFYKWCYRQLHLIHLTIALKLWRMVRYSPKFGPLVVENWESIINGGDSVGNFTELFEPTNSKDNEFFGLAKHISSLLLKTIRIVAKLKVMYTERLNSSKTVSSQLGKCELLKLLEMMSNVVEVVEKTEKFTLSGRNCFSADSKVIRGNNTMDNNATTKCNVNHSFACDMSVYADENLSLLHEWGFIQTDDGCMSSCFCGNSSNSTGWSAKKRTSGINHTKYKMGSDNPICKYFTEPFEPIKLSQFWSFEEPILINLLSRCYSVVPIDGIGSESACLSQESPQVLQGILIASTVLQIGVSPNLFVLNRVDKKGFKTLTRPETQITLIPLYIHSLLLYNHVFNSVKRTKTTCWSSPRVLISLHASIHAFDKLLSVPVLLPIEVYAANSDMAIRSHNKYLESAHLSNFRAFQFVTASLLKGLKMDSFYGSDDRGDIFDDHDGISLFRASKYEKNCMALFALRSLFGDEYDNCFGTSVLYLDPFFIKAEQNCRRKLFRGRQVLIDKLPVNKSLLRKAVHNLAEANIVLEMEKNEFSKANLTMGEKFEKMSKIITSLFDKARKFERMHKDYVEFSNLRIEFYESINIILFPYLEKLVGNWKDNEILPCTDKLFNSFETVLMAPSDFEDVLAVKEAIINQFMLLFKDKFLVGLTRRLDSVINMVSQTVAKDDFKPISTAKGIHYSCWVSDLVSLLRHTVCICFKFSAPIEWLIAPIFEMSEKVIGKYTEELARILKYDNVIDNGRKLKSSAKAISDILESEDFGDHLLSSEKLDTNYPADINMYIVSLHNLILISSEMEITELDERITSSTSRSLTKAGRKRVFKKTQASIMVLENVIAWRIILNLIHLGGCDKISVIRREFGLLCDRLLESLPDASQKSIYSKAHDALVSYVSYIAKKDLENGYLAEIANKGDASTLLSSINDLCIQTCRSGIGDTASAQSQFANLITFLTISLNTDTPLNTERKRHPKLAKLGLKVMKKYEAIMGGGRQAIN